MSDAELSRLETSIKRYLAQYWWAIIPSIIAATIWVTHQNTVAEDTKAGVTSLQVAFAEFAKAQQTSALKAQHIEDELARHEWMATNHENRLQWIEHRSDTARQ